MQANFRKVPTLQNILRNEHLCSTAVGQYSKNPNITWLYSCAAPRLFTTGSYQNYFEDPI